MARRVLLPGSDNVIVDAPAVVITRDGDQLKLESDRGPMSFFGLGGGGCRIVVERDSGGGIYAYCSAASECARRGRICIPVVERRAGSVRIHCDCQKPQDLPGPDDGDGDIDVGDL